MRNDPKICSVVWNLIRGGTEGQCARVAMGLAEAGVPHRVAVFRREGFFLDAVESACGPVYPFSIERFRGKETRATIAAFAAWLRSEKMDGVHTWDKDANLFASQAARQAGIPYITSRRDMGEIYPWYKLWLQRRAERGAQRVVVNAQAIGAWAATDRVPESKICPLPNIVPLAELEAGRSAAGETIPRCGEVQWIHVARLDPEKDVELLIRAVARLREAGHEAGLWIVGDGGERPDLEALVQELQVGTSVQFLGGRDDVPQLLAQAGAGVLVPRANEGQSNTVLEYMAVGLPVVVSDCGGNRELVEGSDCGVVVPVGDVEALAEAMRDVGEWDVERRHATGARGRERVVSTHVADQVLPRFRSLYSEVFS